MDKNLTGTERRNQIIEIIKNSKNPISGTKLGNEVGVSRQIVVQDIALIRTMGYDIVSTARGYLYNEVDEKNECQRVIKVCHSDSEVEDELTTIVDVGGNVIDVMVNHRTYGKVTAPLNIKSRRDVKNFVEDLKSSKSSLLSNVTSGYHFHTISAETEDILDEIEKLLKQKGYLAEVLEYEKL